MLALLLLNISNDQSTCLIVSLPFIVYGSRYSYYLSNEMDKLTFGFWICVEIFVIFIPIVGICEL